jgi:Ras-related protein Rab-11A
MDKESYEFLFKLILIGDSSVGKSNILLQYLKGKFDANSKATVGVEFGTKNIEINNKKIKIQIWDTAGQERYRSITSAYYRGAKGAFIVYDITRKETFDNIDKWVADLKNNGDDNISIVLIGNKSDLDEKREVSKEEGVQKSEEFKTAFMETSALNGDNIDKAFDELIEQIYQNNCSMIDEGDKVEIEEKGVNLNEEKEDNKSIKDKCCN